MHVQQLSDLELTILIFVTFTVTVVQSFEGLVFGSLSLDFIRRTGASGKSIHSIARWELSQELVLYTRRTTDSGIEMILVLFAFVLRVLCAGIEVLLFCSLIWICLQLSLYSTVP